jgi:hypothetical protein
MSALEMGVLHVDLVDLVKDSLAVRLAAERFALLLDSTADPDALVQWSVGKELLGDTIAVGIVD